MLKFWASAGHIMKICLKEILRWTLMHAKTQMNSEDTKGSEVDPSQKDRRYLAHLKGEMFTMKNISVAGDVWE